jgi:F0F1-type ATP synthase membrane subunit b/b'
MQASKDAAAMVAESQKLIEEVQRELEQADQDIRAMGFDPDKVRASMAALLGPKEKAEADRLFAQDLEDAEREVEQAKAALDRGAAGVKSARKPRSMI